MEELLSLKWNNHKSTFLHILTILRDKQMFTDATLACEGKFYSVHRLVLSTCSDYFSAMFDRIESKNPVIVLKDINCVDLEALLDYMYLGEVNVKQSELSSLIKAAECLQVKGLAVPDDEIPKRESVRRKADRYNSPSAKRKRKDEEPSPSIMKSSQDQLLDDHISNSAYDNHLNNSNNERVPTVKLEVMDNTGETNENKVEASNEFFQSTNQFKEELDLDDMSNNLTDFVQPSSSSYSHSFDSPSTQSDLQNWQGDQPVSDNYSVLDFATNQATDSTSTQNPPGIASSSTFGRSSIIDVERLKRAIDEDINSTTNGSFVKCSFCGKLFYGMSRRQSLNRHLRIHSGEKPYQCPQCDHRSNLIHNMKRHIRRVHSMDASVEITTKPLLPAPVKRVFNNVLF